MHVLIPVLHRPTKPTGVCRHAANLAECLAITDSVSRITLIIGEWQRAYFERSFNFQSPKIQLVSVDIKNNSLTRNRWYMFELPKLAQELQTHLLHMSFPFPFVRQWFKSPVVSTIHDLYPYECPENFGYPRVLFNQIFLQQCVANSDGLTCVSQCTLDALNTYFPDATKRKQTTVIYNIVDFDGIEPKQPHQLAGGFTAPFLLTVAQHRKNKNLDLLIQAYAALQHDGRLPPNTQLLLVGSSGPETETLRQLVNTLNVEEQVTFLAGLDDGELGWLYKKASLFVIPSSTEGFCLPLIEALASACPAVCSDIPVLREVGDLQCRYFQLDQDALHNLSDAIAAELACPTLSERKIDSRFSKTEIASQLLSFYMSFQEQQD